MRALVQAAGAELAWELLREGEVPDAIGQRARSRVAGARPEVDLETITRLGGRLLCPGDDEWPTALADLPREPLALWVRGDGALDRIAACSVSIVGSRAATSY